MIKKIVKKIYDTDPFLPIILLGAIIRAALFYWAGEDGIEFLVNRIEISTPVNSYKQIKEGVYLFNNSIDPYEGNVFYQSPLLLLIFSLFQNLPLKFLFGIYVQLDIIIGYTLYRLGVMYIFNNPSLLPVFNNDDYLLGMLMGSIYLLNPFTILSTLGLSTSIFQNFAIVSAISHCYQGFPNGGMMMLSFATCLGFYPVSLIPPLYLITYKSETTRTWWNFLNFIFFYALWIFGLTRLSFFYMNDWKFLSQSIGSILFPPDLTPNIGLHWYINIEVFDHFRSFFNSTFQLYSFFFVIPLSIKFRNLPFFVIFLQLGIISTFKSYPSIADFALYTSFLPLFYETFEYLNNTFVIGTALVFCCGLGPLFWEGWVQLETANANFFYAITLVYAICNILLLCSALQARLKFDYLKINPHHKDAKLKFE